MLVKSATSATYTDVTSKALPLLLRFSFKTALVPHKLELVSKQFVFLETFCICIVV